jgi:hypothetical protein
MGESTPLISIGNLYASNGNNAKIHVTSIFSVVRRHIDPKILSFKRLRYDITIRYSYDTHIILIFNIHLVFCECFKILYVCMSIESDPVFNKHKRDLGGPVGLRTSESLCLHHQVPHQRLPDQQCASSATSGNSVGECAHASEHALVHCPCPLLLYIIMCNRNRTSVSYSHSSSIIY